MIAFPFMLENAAKQAGIKVPPDTEDFDPSEFPHFKVFCVAQLARPMQPGEHWENAKVIAKISDDEIRTTTFEKLAALGFQGIS